MCGQCLAGAAKVAVGARPRHWRRAKGDRGGAAKALGAQVRMQCGRSQGPGVDAKAAMRVRPWPWGRGHGGHDDAENALGAQLRQP